MIYKFLIGSEESASFKVEIAIDSEDTFERLRNAILDAAGYDKDMLDSFYICDDEWNKEKEVVYADMDDDTDDDIWLMEDTRLDELVEEEGQKLKFVFDYMTERYFYMKLKEIVYGKSLHDPLCQRKEGRPPKESVEVEYSITPAKVETPSLDDIGEEFYGDEGFSDDELGEFEEITDDEL